MVCKPRTPMRRENEFLLPSHRTRVFPSSAILSGRSRKHPTSGGGGSRPKGAGWGEGGGKNFEISESGCAITPSRSNPLYRADLIDLPPPGGGEKWCAAR